MDCQQAIEKLNSYLDRELTEAEYAQVQRHIEGCRDCESLFSFEEGVLRLVRHHCSKTVAPAGVRDRIQITIQQVTLRKTP